LLKLVDRACNSNSHDHKIKSHVQDAAMAADLLLNLNRAASVAGLAAISSLHATNGDAATKIAPWVVEHTANG
jgi:hypothetical protein